jgi:hypothetical protein
MPDLQLTAGVNRQTPLINRALNQPHFYLPHPYEEK